MLHTFENLDNVSGGSLTGPFSGSITEVLKNIKLHRATSSAGDNGAIMIHRDDSKVIRAEFMRYMASVDAREFKTYKDLRLWLKEWFPKLGRY